LADQAGNYLAPDCPGDQARLTAGSAFCPGDQARLTAGRAFCPGDQAP